MAIEAVSGSNWSRAQTLAALHVYLQLPFGQLHQRNPKLIELSNWIGRTPGSIALKLVNLASLDPVIIASGRSGMGNASALDKLIWKELQTNWDKVALEAVAEYEALATAHEAKPDEGLLDDSPPPESLWIMEEGKTRTATVQVRVNQARFRRAVLSGYNATCCISGLQNERLLIASHIVPWSEDSHNRLNPQNGLCLSALHDRAYDQGLITVLPDYTVRVSPKLKTKKVDAFTEHSLLHFENKPSHMPSRLAPAPEFLRWHAEKFGFL
jgi:putative restriction endonuclease